MAQVSSLADTSPAPGISRNGDKSDDYAHLLRDQLSPLKTFWTITKRNQESFKVQHVLSWLLHQCHIGLQPVTWLNY